jgi:hypothetical protein
METHWKLSGVSGEVGNSEVAAGGSFVRPIIDIDATGTLRLHVIACKKNIARTCHGQRRITAVCIWLT